MLTTETAILLALYRAARAFGGPRPMTQAEIISQTQALSLGEVQLRSGDVSEATTRLEHAGHIVRLEPEGNAVPIRLTDEGMDRANSIFVALAGLLFDRSPEGWRARAERLVVDDLEGMEPDQVPELLEYLDELRSDAASLAGVPRPTTPSSGRPPPEAAPTSAAGRLELMRSPDSRLALLLGGEQDEEG
jgi:hypothetical protein